MQRGRMNRAEENKKICSFKDESGKFESFPAKQSEQHKDQAFKIMKGLTSKLSGCQR